MTPYRRFRALGFTAQQAAALALGGYTVWLVPFDALLEREPEPTLDRA